MWLRLHALTRASTRRCARSASGLWSRRTVWEIVVLSVMVWVAVGDERGRMGCG